MICIHHNRDLDGFASGAIVKRKYPDCTLIGWDYSEPLPDFEQFRDQEVIMIDITFKIDQIYDLMFICKHLTIIDHHIGIKRDIVAAEHIGTESETTKSLEYIAPKFRYIYEDGIAACEIGWQYLFPDEPIPYGILLLSRYDTWRKTEGNWEGETLPFQMYMKLVSSGADKFAWDAVDNVNQGLLTGKILLEYQRKQNKNAAYGAFVREVGGLRAICLNTNTFSSQVFDTVWNPEEHDIMLPFNYQQGLWKCSLYTEKPEIDCSVLAKARGGGGHKMAAGFEVKNFEDIFK